MNIVFESLDDILKPKTEEEIEQNLIKIIEPGEEQNWLSAGIHRSSLPIVKVTLKLGAMPLINNSSGPFWAAINTNQEKIALYMLQHEQIKNLIINDNKFRLSVLNKIAYYGMKFCIDYILNNYGYLYTINELKEIYEDSQFSPFNGEDNHRKGIRKIKEYIKEKS